MALENSGSLREFLDRMISDPQTVDPICLRFVNNDIVIEGQCGEPYTFIVTPNTEPISESGFEPDMIITYGSECVSRILEEMGGLFIISDQDGLPENFCHVCDQPFRHCDCEPNLEWEMQFNQADDTNESV